MGLGCRWCLKFKGKIAVGVIILASFKSLSSFLFPLSSFGQNEWK